MLLLQQSRILEEQSSQLRKLKEERETGEEEEEKVTSSGKCRLEKMAPHLLQYLKKQAQKESVTVHEIKPNIEGEGSENPALVHQPPPPDPKVFIPHRNTMQGIVLVESMPQKSTEHHTGKTQPVKKEFRIGTQFYCDKCKSNFCRKDLLANHIKNDCLQVVHGFICDACNKGFYSETAITEHYFVTHLKQPLYFCARCNEGFQYKS